MSKLNTNEKWARAFSIFARYGESDVSAEHDEVYAGPDPSTVGKLDLEELDVLGWFPSDDYNCFKRFT